MAAARAARRLEHVELLRQEPDGNGDRSLGVIERNTEPLQSLTDDRLTLSRVSDPDRGHARGRRRPRGAAAARPWQRRGPGAGRAEPRQQRREAEFFRGTNPQALQVPGTGLGLSIAQRVVTRHGGRIDVESELGRGTSIRLLLPAHGRA
ncbi:ATP-binding protein [Terrabacter sp. Root181]|uniref:ATP-binding protein n=1 Tax=Terrabacter sp. Root181 TaxID=1736484 RepID=UPI0006FD4C1A|nr:ATP-binding protein [Terrabacter sp. Root181]KRB47524.1 hypothetical protein ASD90_04055 [Terrabacter sp. Root181]